jgi:sec-independent protein translocase protein TatC
MDEHDQKAVVPPGGNYTPPPPPEEDDEVTDGMLRMSFMDHLEELRARIIRALMGLGAGFVATIYFASDLWNVVKAPAQAACDQNHIRDCLVATSPSEGFTVLWVKLPMLAALFLSSPWILYQVWAFIAPGLYKSERRWALPFVLFTAGLFIAGGLFAYFVAFRLGLAFLLGITVGGGVTSMLSITEYFDLFINVSLGMGLVFELPILIFFLALLRIVTASFLLRHSRYAILIIVVVAAVLTPTPDVVNLMLISVPMTLLYFGGVFAAFLLTLHRENKSFPWLILFLIVAGFAALIAAGVYWAVVKYGYHLVSTPPFLMK